MAAFYTRSCPGTSDRFRKSTPRAKESTRSADKNTEDGLFDAKRGACCEG